MLAIKIPGNISVAFLLLWRLKHRCAMAHHFFKECLASRMALRQEINHFVVVADVITHNHALGRKVRKCQSQSHKSDQSDTQHDTKCNEQSLDEVTQIISPQFMISQNRKFWIDIGVLLDPGSALCELVREDEVDAPPILSPQASSLRFAISFQIHPAC